MEPEEVTLQLLREMTDDFSSERQVGEGSFGVVYRGVTHAGEDVAVKMLKPNSYNTDAGSKQFKNEIYNLAMLKHQNIVQVLGYCYETEKKSLVFNGKTVLTEETHRAICLEYLHKGSLREHLSDESGGLDWETRFKIIKGTCEGLKYFLHDLEVPLCHFDLKPENILLDKDMAPKIADFGLSMIFGKDQKWTTQYPLGTLGYQPPEYIDSGEVTDKFDIFSLGVVMVMIVSGPKGYYKCGDMSSDEFTNQVQKTWRHRLQETINGSLLEMYCRQVDTCIQIALKCVDKDWQRRPDIVMITEMLNEIETYNCTLPWNGCHKNDSRATRNNNQRRKEWKDITSQHHNRELMTGLNCRKLEFVGAQETSSYVVKELIVGRDEEKVNIVTSLLQVISKPIIILPIHGIGGIGKTTLARLIYNDLKFKSYSQVWVDVTQRFDLAKIRKSIVSQLSGEESCDNERQMKHSLTNLLYKKKILVILDDLWEDNQFQLDELKAMLYNKDSNIIVLVTTRSESVADRICTNLQPHKISPLTDDMCWDIIKQKSGFDARDDNKQLISIGLEIAQKCGGVALAAQSLGFTLRSMNIDQWMKVKDSDIWNLPNDHVLPSLQLSYSYMAPCLKTCFTYCAIFPKGHKMVKDDLIYQWISLDFIKPTKLLSSMHLCDKYIGQLLGLSFFQHYSLSPKTVAASYEDVTVFTMHDLVHDLARSLLVDEILEARKQGDTGESRIHFELLDDSTKSLQAFTQYPTNIRRLRFLESDRTMSHGGASYSSAKFKYVQVFSSAAKDLHVLDLSECSIRKLPNSIGNLKQLRYLNAPRVQHWVFPYHVMKLSKLTYLSLRGSSAILALPDSIGEMEGLMYLDLSGCYGIKKLPVSFGKLTKLVHLDFSHCYYITYVSESLKSLTNLEYLDLSHCWHIGDLSENLGCLLKLRNLNISNSSYVKWDSDDYWANAEVLFNLTKLECMNFSLYRHPSEPPMIFRNLPKALNRFSNLKYLNLAGLDLQTEHWPIRREGPIAFENLKNLVHLDLSWCSGVHGVLDNLGSLTKLQHLDLSTCSCFDDCTELHHSRMLEAIGNLTELSYLSLSYCSKHPKQVFFDFLECIGNLPNLEHLDLSGNQSLKSLPDSFRGLRKLHTVDLSNCRNLQVLPSFLSEMDRLKFILLNGCANELDMSKHNQLNKIALVLPSDVVHSDSHDSESNLFLINDVNRYDLVVSRLENVRSVQEACSIKLAGKDRMKKLELNWTKDVERYVEDMELLGELVPPTTLEELNIEGYNSVRFPEWFVGSIAFHLPNVVCITMSDFPKCNNLPPLGQLPNLKGLYLVRMNGISEINWDLCGSRWAFPRLKYFRLSEMESLKVWYTTYPGGRDGMSQFMFPNLSDLNITDCPNLRMKPCPHRVSKKWIINGRSDDLISSWGEGEGKEASQISVTSSASVPVPALVIKGCKVPMHQWRLLHHLPCLTTLTIIDCSDLSISPEITRALSSLREMRLGADDPGWEFKLPAGKLELPNWLGQLASLENLTVCCGEVKAPHDGFPHLTRLCSLYLAGFESMTTLHPWVGTLASLQCLKTQGCKNLNDLTESIGRLTSLKKLEIISDSMKSLPESIGCLTSLEELSISHCYNITSLPESIQQLTNLKRLHIYECKKLEKWCKTEENKTKLAHIKEKATPVSSSLGAMGPLFTKLDLLLARKYPLRRSIKHAIKLLKEDLEDIVDALVEQSMVDSPDNKGKYWMHEVRELSYDIEDAIDALMLPHIAGDGKVRVRSVPGHRVGRLKIKGLPYMVKPLTRIARVTELRTLLWEANERHQRYELDVCISNPKFLLSSHSSRIPVPREVAGNLVGVDAPKNELTTWLTAQAEQLKILCIVGPAGVGKTALAKELYRELGSQFECRAFVRVSRTPHMSTLLLGILFQIQRHKQNFDTCSVPNIINEIKKHLQDKRYFIVIDGLWEARVWDIIKSAFTKGHNCSRIMITCEDKDVATKFCSYHSIDVFELKPLGSQDSEKLFFDTMSAFNVQCHDQLKEVSRIILRACNGLPLATITIAGLLATQPDNHLLQYFFSDLANLTLEEMLKGAVSLCYNSLPQDLKTCLLYLTMYPEGCSIRKVDLLKQWIAEGFISPTTEEKERVAENYFAELVNRGMIQPEKIIHNDEVISCTVHHIVFDVIMHKSREVSFTAAVDYSQTVTEFFTKIYRLSLYFSCAQYATKLEGIRLSQIRSLFFYGLHRCIPSLRELKLLRVLILEFWADNDDCISLNLSMISGLFLLRYLKISSHMLVELPSKIKELKFLETMEIDARVWAIPDDIVHLPGLLHLSIQDEAELPEGIGRVTSLQTLRYFDLGNNSEGNVRSLCELINLRDLHITCSTALSDAHLKRKFVVLAGSLLKLTNLRSLSMAPGAVSTIMFVDHSSVMLSTPMFLQRLELLPPICIFSRLPEWVGKLQKLRILKIVVRVLLSSDIDVLTGLPGLTVLSLYIRQPNTQSVVFSSGALPVLKYFKYTCGALFLAFQEEALPQLERLKLRFNVHKGENEMYCHMNSGIENLLNLKEMTVKIGAADDATESDKKAAESAIESAICKHPRFPIYVNVRRIGWVEEV